jgi:hypothetical protein
VLKSFCVDGYLRLDIFVQESAHVPVFAVASIHFSFSSVAHVGDLFPASVKRQSNNILQRKPHRQQPFCAPTPGWL